MIKKIMIIDNVFLFVLSLYQNLGLLLIRSGITNYNCNGNRVTYVFHAIIIGFFILFKK